MIERRHKWDTYISKDEKDANVVIVPQGHTYIQTIVVQQISSIECIPVKSCSWYNYNIFKYVFFN